MKTSDISPRVTNDSCIHASVAISLTETSEGTHSLPFNPKEAVVFLEQIEASSTILTQSPASRGLSLIIGEQN